MGYRKIKTKLIYVKNYIEMSNKFLSLIADEILKKLFLKKEMLPLFCLPKDLYII